MPALRDALALHVATARDVTQSVTARHADADDRDARWPAETMRALADAGLLGLTAPRDVGGLEAGMRGLVAVSEALAHESASAGSTACASRPTTCWATSATSSGTCSRWSRRTS